MRGVIALVVVGVLLFLGWVLIGGQDTTVPDAPNPDLPLPNNPRDAADKGWDFIDKAPPWVWSQVAPIVIIGVVLAIIAKKLPKLSLVILGGMVGIIGFVIFKNN